VKSLARLLPLVLGLGSAACQPSPSREAAHPGLKEGAQARGRLPARLRRLSNPEYAKTLSSILGLSVSLPESFPRDVLVGGFSSNARQGIDPTYMAEAQKLARELAARAVSERLSTLVPCAPSAPGCAEQFVAGFARRVYRRAARAEEVAAGLRLFEAASKTGGFASGVEQVIATFLVSPELLYVSELGAPVSPGLRQLTSEETASVLAYTLTGGPPDEPLSSAGSEGRLALPEQRAEHAWRLLSQSETRYQFRRFVREWLGLDALASLTKPVADDQRLRLGLLAETDAFVDEVFMYEGASLDRLLAANFTVIPASLHAFEGLPPAPAADHYGRVSLEGSARLGLLQQPSFLAVHAHESQSAPVLRGKVILERFLCVELPRPTELGLQVTFPPPDPRLTTRERHAQHTEDATCRSCHRTIDALGYPFENFDFIGRVRVQENQRRVDTRTSYDGPEGPASFEDSRDVSRWLAQNARAHECFARQAFRFFTGHADAALERAFLDERNRLPEVDRPNLLQSLVAFIQSPLFVERAVEEAKP
jgi:hypothetical protein